MTRTTSKSKQKGVEGSDLDLRVVDTVEGFQSLQDDWNALAQRSAAPHQLFQDFGFLRHWVSHYLGARHRLQIIVAYRGTNIVAILPLVRQRWLGLDTLRFMGIPVARFSDLLIDADAGEPVVQALRAKIGALRADIIDAPLVRQDSAFVRVGFDQDAAVLSRLDAPFCVLADRIGDDGPGPAYSAKIRSNYRRRVRNLAGPGELLMRQYQAGPEAAGLAHAAVVMKKAWLEREKIGAPTLFDPRFEAFFARMAGDQEALASINVSTLERDERPIGIDLSFDHKGHCFGHVIATDACAEKDGAGSVLVHHVFATAKARGNTVFELLTPASEHKMRHADGVTKVRDLVIPLSVKGRIACQALLVHGLPAAKSLLRRFPASLTRAIASRTGY
ncbi:MULTISPECIES: GNAT family N-acetyltransferase [unclassified Mesorhizobium]|uniref:GNAT family N-acetyltransferase n=1 Tax=unclassified Mesorhizobium TaxID=325217 RepID=UPI001267846D|nr:MULTISPECIES: GNAT family N-acetyltransferase [unclassified Mesorhizobium]MBN9234252.1 GNAT family N-acetyltransferase [Mesorhizobium sp.]